MDGTCERALHLKFNNTTYLFVLSPDAFEATTLNFNSTLGSFPIIFGAQCL
jgi:hypothetical protein